MKDTLESYLSALFPGSELNINKGEPKFSIEGVDDLRYIRRVNDVIVGLIHLAKYVSEEY
jgi:hypothetical protein